MSKRISPAFAVTEGKVHLALPENCPYKGVRGWSGRIWNVILEKDSRGRLSLHGVTRWGWGLRKIKAALEMRVAFILCLGIVVIVIS